MASTTTKKPAKQSSKIGLVESDRCSKTRKVVVPNLSTHPKYGKIIRRRSVLHIHDEANQSHLGDLVEIVPCTPVSKTKRWKLLRVVRKNAAKAFQAVEAPASDA